jgi:hypothetical protein
VVSSGEYNPPPQTEQQRQVEGLIKELADEQAAKLSVDRRRFLASSAGMAMAFLAMNKVFGPIFGVSEAEARDLDVAAERAKGCRVSSSSTFRRISYTTASTRRVCSAAPSGR